jgi:hypothetical protein
MSWTFKVAEWSFEVDWQGMTVTPPAPDNNLRREREPEETTPRFELCETPALEEGKTQAWA